MWKAVIRTPRCRSGPGRGRRAGAPATRLRRVALPELRGALGAHVARADRGGPAAQVVGLGRDRDRAGDAHEGVRRALVVDAQRGDPVAGQRAALDRVRAGVEDEVVAVEHEPDRHHVGPAVVARRGELAGARALAHEGAPLGVVHGAGHGAKIPGMSGPPPDLFDALPEQYFTRIVDRRRRGARAARPAADRPRPRQSRPAAATRRARGADRPSSRPRAACTATRPSRAAPSCARRSRRTTAPTTAWSSTPSARSRWCRGPRRRSCSPCWPARTRARPSPCPIPATRTTCPPSRSRGCAGCALALDAAAGWQPDFDALGEERPALVRPQLPLQPVRGVRGAGDLRGRRRVGARARQLAAQRPRLRLPGLRRAPRAQRARGRRRPRGGRRAVVALEGLRHGRLAGGLRGRQRGGRRAHPRRCSTICTPASRSRSSSAWWRR